MKRQPRKVNRFADYYRRCRLAKPVPSAVKARAVKRTEAAVIKAVRALCVLRDGYCLAARRGYASSCGGPSEWAHLGAKRRARTQRQDPMTRHVVNGSAMLCKIHHTEYDGKSRRFALIIDQHGDDCRTVADEWTIIRYAKGRP